MVLQQIVVVSGAYLIVHDNIHNTEEKLENYHYNTIIINGIYILDSIHVPKESNTYRFDFVDAQCLMLLFLA